MRKWAIGAFALAVAGTLTVSAVAFGGVANAGGPGAGDQGGRYTELLAQKLGISVEQLQAARKAARDQLIDDAVAQGRITAEQGAQLKLLEPGSGRLKGLGRDVAGVVKNVIEAAAGVIGITSDELKTELQAGKSLAQVASERGVSRDQLKSGLSTELKSRIEQAVQNGRLTRAQADLLNGGLDAHLDGAVDRTWPQGGAKGARPGLPGRQK